MGYFIEIINPTGLSESKICILVFPFQVSVPAVPPTAEITLKAEFITSLGENFWRSLSAGGRQVHGKKKNGCKSSAISTKISPPIRG